MQETQDTFQTMVGDINPYDPGKIAGPNEFCGRHNELQTLAGILRRHVGGSPLALIVTGERGVGKSSFLEYFKHMCTHKYDGTTVLNRGCLFVEFSFDRSEITDTFFRRILELAENVAAQKSLRILLFNKGWRLLTQIKSNFFTFTERPVTAFDLAHFIEKIQKISSRLYNVKYDLMFILDECEKSSDSINLGGFIKNFSEGLTKRKITNCGFIACGVDGFFERLAQQHPSVTRMDHITLPRLSPDDCRTILEDTMQHRTIFTLPQTQ